jgi:hypothetical protein
VASRVQTAVTMRQVTGSMMNVVKGMDQAMKAMDLEKVCFSSARSLPCVFTIFSAGPSRINSVYMSTTDIPSRSL